MLMEIESAILLWIQNNLRCDFLTPVMRVITTLGNGGAFWIVVTRLLLIFRRTRRVGVYCAASMLLTLLEGDGQPFLDMMFEAFSAMATVGVSSAGTPNLSAGSKTVLALMMFFGRVGPLTMASALASRQNRNASKIRYPEEEITIG